MTEDEGCERCPPIGMTWYEGKEWTCRHCGTTWVGNALDNDRLVEPKENNESTNR